MSYRIGIDVGGTFTDFVLVGGEELTLLKSPTTLEDQSVGVMRGISALAETEGTTLRELLEQTELVVHGTTTADNTMIEMNGAVTGLLTTVANAAQPLELTQRNGTTLRMDGPAQRIVTLAPHLAELVYLAGAGVVRIRKRLPRVVVAEQAEQRAAQLRRQIDGRDRALGVELLGVVDDDVAAGA